MKIPSEGDFEANAWLAAEFRGRHKALDFMATILENHSLRGKKVLSGA
jgi:hypothetical protein